MSDVYQYEGSTISRMKKSIILICISSVLFSLPLLGQTNSPANIEQVWLRLK